MRDHLKLSLEIWCLSVKLLMIFIAIFHFFFRSSLFWIVDIILLLSLSLMLKVLKKKVFFYLENRLEKKYNQIFIGITIVGSIFLTFSILERILIQYPKDGSLIYLSLYFINVLGLFLLGTGGGMLLQKKISRICRYNYTKDEIRIDQGSISLLSRIYQWHGDGTQEYPYLINGNPRRVGNLKLQGIDKFMIINYAYFEAIDLRYCKNIIIEDCKMWWCSLFHCQNVSIHDNSITFVDSQLSRTCKIYNNNISKEGLERLISHRKEKINIILGHYAILGFLIFTNLFPLLFFFPYRFVSLDDLALLIMFAIFYYSFAIGALILLLKKFNSIYEISKITRDDYSKNSVMTNIQELDQFLDDFYNRNNS